ncbi:Oidioi.mRNA.OKI2018_I69.chr2.g5495.t1.cds [Oikopleura dioica]|uniref:Oidioi.mRNA.OKI2018_I69.chr2.g5495.t1.cds n=1 Tax=Oikopleura dioica TaxID=34765 RepID=A0ABN7T3U4_OIKDI|nr:Oidioi.mRNA.OKI2018_I69.chr2.g5495.t1.cds [Oikopleura dioica]
MLFQNWAVSQSSFFPRRLVLLSFGVGHFNRRYFFNFCLWTTFGCGYFSLVGYSYLRWITLALGALTAYHVLLISRDQTTLQRNAPCYDSTTTAILTFRKLTISVNPWLEAELPVQMKEEAIQLFLEYSLLSDTDCWDARLLVQNHSMANALITKLKSSIAADHARRGYPRF